MIQTSVVGGYPKTIGDQKIRKTLWRVDEGQVSPDELEQVYKEMTELAIREQEDAGLDVITDGGLGREDEVTYIARGLEGFKIGGLTRFFDTNVLYRQPRVVDKIQWREPFLCSDFSHAKKVARRPLKQVLTSPFTIMKLSIDDFYRDADSLLMDLSEALNREILALEEAGATSIQINEYALPHAQEELPLFAKALARLVSDVSAETVLYFSFGDVEALFPELINLPVASIGIDFTYSPGCLQSIESIPPGKKLLAGIVDARNTRLESREDMHRILGALTSHMDEQDLMVATSASLEFLPLDRCRSKLANMVRLVREYGERYA